MFCKPSAAHILINYFMLLRDMFCNEANYVCRDMNKILLRNQYDSNNIQFHICTHQRSNEPACTFVHFSYTSDSIKLDSLVLYRSCLESLVFEQPYIYIYHTNRYLSIKSFRIHSTVDKFGNSYDNNIIQVSTPQYKTKFCS